MRRKKINLLLDGLNITHEQTRTAIFNLLNNDHTAEIEALMYMCDKMITCENCMRKEIVLLQNIATTLQSLDGLPKDS
jgi:hypothetical protein